MIFLGLDFSWHKVFSLNHFLTRVLTIYFCDKFVAISKRNPQAIFPLSRALEVEPWCFLYLFFRVGSSPSTFDLCSLIATFTCSQYPLPRSVAESFDQSPLHKPTLSAHKNTRAETPLTFFSWCPSLLLLPYPLPLEVGSFMGFTLNPTTHHNFAFSFLI